MHNLYRYFLNLSAVNIFTVLPLGISVLVILFIMVLVFKLGRHIGHAEVKAEQDALVREGRKDAVRRSRAVLGGQMGEQIAPFLPGFPCNPADVRFVGKPVDFVGFPGAAMGESVQEILFIEVKTGNSMLSRREREIRDAIAAGRVRYVEYNPGICE